ncbi:hypothetical protein [Glutamicibacter sp. NPDC087673]|uniref:hypothetical protein n=1 Tax=Glutamicibacter sp. NPDC087673 TaxID=3363997 RepID=UPI00382C00A3
MSTEATRKMGGTQKMRQSKAGRVSEKHARRTNQELQALSEPPMNDPFEHLIAKTEFDSGVYDQISKAFTLILAGVAILFAGGSLAGVAPSIWVLVLWSGLVVVLGVLGFMGLGASISAKRAAIAVYKHRYP